jgi:hypothetical protein
VLLEQFKNSKNAIIDVAESRSFRFLGMMQSPSPVNNRVSLVIIQADGTPDASTGVKLAELKESIENRAIFSHVESLQLANVILHVIRGDYAEEVDVIVRVEPCHGGRGYMARAEYFHAPV